MPFFFWLVGWLISRLGISVFLWAEPSSFSLRPKAAILDFWGRVPRRTASLLLSVTAAFGLMEPGRGLISFLLYLHFLLLFLFACPRSHASASLLSRSTNGFVFFHSFQPWRNASISSANCPEASADDNSAPTPAP